MNQWKITLASGPQLREAVSAVIHATTEIAEKQAQVLDALEKCVAECINRLPEDDRFDFEDFQETIAGEAAHVRKQDPLIQEMGFASAEDLVDELLDQFYDLCDLYKVWVGFAN